MARFTQIKHRHSKVNGRNSLAFAKEIMVDNQPIPVKGFAEPMRIDDSYALGLQIRIPEKDGGLKTADVAVSILKQLPQRAVKYARMLSDLQFRENTIAINAQNYQDKLNQISLDIKASKKYNDSDADLSFVATFSTQNCPQFQRQIQADLGYFQHGSGLLNKAMEAIRGVVSIEEAYRDAKLEVTIQAVGFGLGVAGVVAGGAPYLIKQDAPDRKFYLPLLTNVEIHPFVLVLLISLGAGGAVWFVFMFGIKIKQLLPKIKQQQLPPFR
ncbi:MAG: hypothetical protein ACM65L_09465 [Microcoleus sp.]